MNSAVSRSETFQRLITKIKHTTFKETEPVVFKQTLHLPNHEVGLQQVVALLTDATSGVIKNPEEIDMVGHRVVHGGEKYSEATLIDENVKAEIKKLFSLAPLHNPANYTGIEVAEKVFIKAKQVAVFDTAFHQTMPEHAFRYAIPNECYTQLGIRAYGFHGTSHQYVTGQAMRYLNNSSACIISIHLGNGYSVAAVKAGKSIDTSMGFGPLSGLIMGTRSGDIDPSVVFHLIDNAGYTSAEINSLLNKQSGMLGLTGFNDMRDVNTAAGEGMKEAELALEVYAYRIHKYIGAYFAAMNGLDAIVFTAGVRENDSRMRERICSDMDFSNIAIDVEKNNIGSASIREIGKADAKVKILVVPTNEELEIATQAYKLLTAER